MVKFWRLSLWFLREIPSGDPLFRWALYVRTSILWWRRWGAGETSCVRRPGSFLCAFLHNTHKHRSMVKKNGIVYRLCWIFYNRLIPAIFSLEKEVPWNFFMACPVQSLGETQFAKSSPRAEQWTSKSVCPSFSRVFASSDSRNDLQRSLLLNPVELLAFICLPHRSSNDNTTRQY